HRFDKDDGYIIEMPTPRNPRECFFLAIVRNGVGSIDYLTLERTDDDGVMLCGWDAEGNHLNYGDRASRDLDGLIVAVIARRVRSPSALRPGGGVAVRRPVHRLRAWQLAAADRYAAGA